jgi:hypothetical protein
MATRAQLEAYDRKKATMFETSILTTGTEDFFGKAIEKIGRRYVWRFERFNNQGVQVSGWMYMSDVIKALKSGALQVFKK